MNTMRKSGHRTVRRDRPAIADAAIVGAVFVGLVLFVGLATIALMGLLLEAGLIEVQQQRLSLPALPGQASFGGSASSCSSMHLATASVLVRTASLPYRCLRCVLTVLAERKSDAAISSFE